MLNSTSTESEYLSSLTKVDFSCDGSNMVLSLKSGEGEQSVDLSKWISEKFKL